MGSIVFDGVTVERQDQRGTFLAVDNVSLTISERRVGIIGANGSGKSTLARLINGLVDPTAGTVTVDGLDVSRDGAAVRRKVGFILTDPDAQIVMPTVAEDVAFSLSRSKLSSAEKSARVADALKTFGLTDLAHRSVSELSGGQKQLLALASVTVAWPAWIVADEPTTLLDARNTRLLSNFWKKLPQQLVVVTHHLETVESFDRVLVMDQGKVVEDAAPKKAIAAYRKLVGA